MEDCKFTDSELLAINNCIHKFPDGIKSVTSIQPIMNPHPIEHDNFISFRIGLAIDAALLIDTAINRITGVEVLNTYNNFESLNSLLFPCTILMRTIMRRMVDLSFLWKHPENTADYRDHQISRERGEWADTRLGLKYKDKTEQGIIVVINEIYEKSLTNDYLKQKSEHFNDNYYGKHAIERYHLTDKPLINDEFIRNTKGNIIQCIIECYEYIDLIIKGFEKYEQVQINNTAAMDITKDTLELLLIRHQYHS